MLWKDALVTRCQKIARPFSSSIQANHIPPITDTASQENTETSGFMLLPPLKKSPAPGRDRGNKLE